MTSVRARALCAAACGLAALLCFESAASAQPPKLRRLQQQQQQRQAQQPAPPPAAEPAPAAPPAVEPAPIAAEPAPAPIAAEPAPAPIAADAAPAPPTAQFAPIAPEPAAPAPLVAEPAPAPQSAQQPPAPLASETAPVLLSAPPDRTADRADASSDSAAGDKPRQFGAMLDLGVPDGTMLSFVYRPIEMARFHAGAGYNGISPGLRLGGVFLPFGWGPALGIDYGHYFEGDANGLAGLFGDTGEGSVVLESIGYDYVNFRGGMDFGGERFTFFAHGGISWLRTTIHEFDTLLDQNGDAQSNTSIEIRKDPVLNAWVPNLQLGFIVHL